MKKSNLFARVIAAGLSVMMLASVVPMTAMAANYDTSVSKDYYAVLSKKEYPLAPGATETEMVLNNAEGSRRQIAHVFEVDPKNENIEVLPGYYGIDRLDPDNLSDGTCWTDGKVTDTVAYYENELGYNVVGAMNTALAYDSNAPYGYMVYNGEVVGTPDVHKGAQTYLAIYKDGTCELRSMSTPLDGNEWQAVSANFGWLVKDGELVTKTVERTSSPASRSMIGIKADGSLVFCQVDGRMAPTAVGLSNYEMGEMMLALGCVNAVNCDGGGSSTFVSKREGTDENVMRSIPSDGSERPTINSVIIVSTAKATGEFDHANLSTEYDYYAPGTQATMQILGVDAAGGTADVPTDVSWQLSDDSFGTVADGVFTSNGTVGDVDVEMVYNGKVVGSKTVSIVEPDSFGFDMESTVIPYGKSVEIGVVAAYGPDDAAVCVEGVYELELSDEDAAELDGNVLIAGTDDSKKGVTVTVTYANDSSKTDVLSVDFGKGSEIVFDFEDGDISEWMGFDEAKQWNIDNGVENTLTSNSPIGGQFSPEADSNTFLADAESGGQVKNGKYSLGVNFDYTAAEFANWTYNILYRVGAPVVLRDVANGNTATTFGAWVYIPEGAAGLAMQLTVYCGSSATSLTPGTQLHFYFDTVSGARKNLNSCTEADIPESRWVYATVDLTAYNYVSFVDPTGNIYREPTFIRTYIKPTAPAVHTFYFDDFTLDYSSAVEDRVLPTITDVAYATDDTSVGLAEGATINSNNVTFSATVADNVGVDRSTGQIYVDGNEVDTTVSGKMMASEEVTLTSGVHTISFEIKDALGNTALVTRTITVSGNAVITLSGHNDSGKPAEYDSVYYADINVADSTSIEELTAVLKLQNANTWEPEGMVVADGFTADYDYNEISGLLTVTVEKDVNMDAVALEENETLVSIPIRVWSWDAINHVTGAVITPEKQFAGGNCPIVAINYDVVNGSVEFADGTEATFGGKVSVETNLNDNKNPWHYHTEEDVEDVAATCTELGYKDRTYCDVCKSVVEWGTILEPAGHSYDFVEGVLQCTECDEKFTGTYTDGKEYVDGVVAVGDDGWVGDSYYKNGAKLTGVQKAPAPDSTDEFYYNFGDDGVSQGKYTGLFTENDSIYYAFAGKLVNGWQSTADGWYYADTTTNQVQTGEFAVNGLTYTADETGLVVKGAWVTTADGKLKYSYGPAFYTNGWQTIEGNQYFFGTMVDGGYAYTGLRSVLANPNNPKAGRNWYTFDETGKLIDDMSTFVGFLTEDGATYYVKNGATCFTGLTKIDGAYYYLSTTNGKMAVNVTRGVAGDCIDESASDMREGTYTFGADGKMVVETAGGGDDEEVLNGIVGDYYYENGIMKKPGLIKIDGYYYYFSTTNGKMAKNVTRGVAADCIDESASDIKSGTYTFGADGKMVVETVEGDDGELLNGIVGDYYYIDGVVQKPGLIKLDGYYYYFSTTNGKMAKNVTRGVAGDCISESASDMREGTYTFGADGKMVVETAGGGDDEEVLNGIVGDYYYENGIMKKPGLIKIDGYYYYFSTTNGKMAKNVTRGVAADCIDESASDIKSGTYTFGADGKMFVDGADPGLNGIVDGFYYVDGVMQKTGLTKIGDDYYYFSTTNGKMAANVTRGVAADCIHESASDIKSGTYTFGADGKMVR